MKENYDCANGAQSLLEKPIVIAFHVHCRCAKKSGDAESYFDEHLSQNDYYAAGEIRPGQWIGASAERLGLKEASHP